jgi:NAD(P)-dependent dehydrogenase (short-subunit alcohol dehydrogenase family)
MSGLCEGRVAIVTGAGRGIGREHALSLARHGAKVVVNDLGGNVDGSGGDISPAQQVVNEIIEMGGEAVANGDNVADWEGAQRMINTAIETFGDLHALVNNAGILRDRVLANMTEEEWDSVINVHLKGTFAPSRWAVAYWRERAKAGQAGQRADRQHHVGVGHLRQSRPSELRRSEGGDRRVHEHRRPRSGALRRDGQRGWARRSHAA